MGLVQLIALQSPRRTPGLFFRYLRTPPKPPSKAVASEATVTAYLRQSIFRWFAENPHLAITQIIHSKQHLSSTNADFWAS
jgi:hypothetical protein